MKRFILIAFIAFALVACDLPAPTVTEEPGATDTPTTTLEVVTLTPSPSATITLTPTDTATVIPTSTPVPVYTERLENGDFEGGFDNAFYDLGVTYGVADNWYPVVWRGFPIPRPCEDGQTEGCNPSWMTDRVPEYKPANAENGGDPFRTLSGNGQQWFAAEQHSFAGIAQTVQTQAGEQCIVSTWGQTWGAATGRSNVSNELYRSDYATDDDKDNMHLLVVVNPAGDGISFPFPDTYIVEDFGFADGLYDEPDGGAPVGFAFVAAGRETTIAFIGYQLWPAIANWYVDGASVSCAGAAPAPIVDIEKTPTPIATPVAEASVFVVEAQGLESEFELKSEVEGENQMELDTILEVIFAVLVAVPVIGGAVGNLVSAVVDLVKAIIHVAGKQLPDEWAGRIFVLANLVAFVVLFVVTGVNPSEYVLPDQTAQTLALVVNIVAAVTGLLGSLALGGVMHDLLKKFAPTLVSSTARNAPKD